MKKFISALSALALSALIASGTCLTAFADTTATIKGEQTDDDTVAVTLTFTSEGYEVGSLGGQLYYDDSLLQFVSGDASGGGGILNFQAFPMDDSGVIELELEFNVLGDGMSGLYLDSCYVFSYDGMVLAEPTAESTVTFSGAQPVQTETAPPQADESEEEPVADESSEDSQEESKAETETTVTEAPEESEAAEETQTEAENAEPVIQEVQESQPEDASEASSLTESKREDDKYKRALNPALAIVLVVLVVALVMVIIFMKNAFSKKK